ncbi:MAG: type II secretion system GspH family protein [Gemmatimonadetes bacterium]|nr:type II secretion system GspH family protein [Gemmatimonadota bacterium]MBT8405576.1 type II secretion system GspH family protein [Gemmatimonadota bacterium]
MKHRGFSLIELLFVMALIAILVGIAIPLLRVSLARADAARVRTDVRQVEVAALQYREEAGSFPPTTKWGSASDSLAPYLAQGMPFEYKDLEYRMVTTGGPGPTEGFTIQVRYAEDSEIGEALQAFRGADLVWTRTLSTFLLHP